MAMTLAPGDAHAGEALIPFTKEVTAGADLFYLGATATGLTPLKRSTQVIGIFGTTASGFNRFVDATSDEQKTTVIAETRAEIIRRTFQPTGAAIKNLRNVASGTENTVSVRDCGGVRMNSLSLANGHIGSVDLGRCIQQYSLTKPASYDRPPESLGSSADEPKSAFERVYEKPSAALNTPLGTPCLHYNNGLGPSSCADGTYIAPQDRRAPNVNAGRGGWETMTGR